jgi:hypothetical protein
MKSILEELHNGAVYPAELIRSTDPEYRPVNQKIEEEIVYFMDKLSEEDGKRFDKLDELFSRSSYMYATASFAYGFWLATLPH